VTRRLLFVLGTRPEAVKLAPVILEVRRRAQAGAAVEARVCVTAQHRGLLDDVLELFGIVPGVDLDVMEEGQSPTGVAALVLQRLEAVLREEAPDWVVVQGDTTTVAAAALAAYYARCRIGHVEAGLRSHDRWRPFPEELNRRVASVLADLHFAPTARARENLLREGVADERIVVTGNPVLDALLWAVEQPFEWGHLRLPPLGPAVRLVLVTAHRRESFGAPLVGICRALRILAQEGRGALHVVYPVHPNPEVTRTVDSCLRGVDGVTLLGPVNYLAMAHLLKRAHVVLTDSGGLQEEAPALGKPVLVLREVTERPEGVEAGAARVVGTDPTRIVAEALRLVRDPVEHARMARAANPYGDGHAAPRIVDALLEDEP
jgi:UDP-N-acetylglucosamine 2-epimerase (non-hydrolysing)